MSSERFKKRHQVPVTLPYNKLLGKTETINSQSITALIKDSSGNLLMCSGTVTITNAGSGYAKGCIYIKTNAGSGTEGFYRNVGTSTSCIFEALDTVTAGELALAEGNILKGSAGGVAEALDASTDTYIIVGNGTTIVSVAVSGDATLANDGTITIGAGVITSAKMDAGVKKVVTTTIPTAEVLALNTTPKELVPAPGTGKYLIVDRITASVDYNSAAYATNTTLEFKYGTATTKCTADIASLLNATADKVQTVGGIEAELSAGINDNIEVNVATGDPITGDSNIKVVVEYRELSI